MAELMKSIVARLNTLEESMETVARLKEVKRRCFIL